MKDKHITKVLEEFDGLGFGNQARIVGSKRVELKDFIRKEITTAILDERARIVRELEGLKKKVPTQEELVLTVSSLQIAHDAVEFHAHNEAISDAQEVVKGSK